MSERIAIFADTHANVKATIAVLNDIKKQNVDAAWCLGDLIGRGPEPKSTLVQLQRLYADQDPVDQAAWLTGNHDLMVMGRILATQFNASTLGGNNGDAVTMATKNREELDQYSRGDELREFMDALNAAAEPRTGVYVAHALYALDKDGMVNETRASTQRVENVAQVTDAFRRINERLPQGTSLRMMITAHTHISGLWTWDADANTDAVPVEGFLTGTHTFEQLSQRPIYINPGSVGFPRHPDVMPTYVIMTLDDDLGSAQVEFRRVPFDVQAMLDDLEPDYPQKFKSELERIAQFAQVTD